MIRLAVLMLAALVVAPAQAQIYPSQTVRWIVPLPPGGSTDLISRLLAQKLSEMWRVQVVVENRVGAAGTIGLAAAAKSPPDGYTIALGQTSNLAVAAGLYPKLGYDPLKDLEPVTQVVSTPMLLVSEVPTMAEDGVPGYDVSVWYGVVMPGGTPKEIVARVHAEVVRILAQPDVNERLTADAGEVVAGTPEAFGAYIKSELARRTK